jgi:hypothetical protein
MNPSTLTSRLVSVAECLGIEVRFEEIEEGRGGLFELRGNQAILVNEALPEEEKAEVLAEALSSFDLDEIFVLPEIREFIERSGRQAD